MTCDKCGRDWSRALEEFGWHMWGQLWKVEITCGSCGHKQRYKGEGRDIKKVERVEK